MSSFSPNDQKAIRWWFESNPQFKPAMTYYPLVSWEIDGKRVEKNIVGIRAAWEKTRERA